jgi:hypothetical protein
MCVSTGTASGGMIAACSLRKQVDNNERFNKMSCAYASRNPNTETERRDVGDTMNLKDTTDFRGSHTRENIVSECKIGSEDNNNADGQEWKGGYAIYAEGVTCGCRKDESCKHWDKGN